MGKFKEEKILGTVPKNYQCVENFWDCPEFSKRNKSKKDWMHSVHSNFNGITLIALIITIIVMLILVGVTITVALNGGLFTTAQNAATNTIIEAEKEQLLSAVATAYDTETGTISKAKLQENLGNNWNVEGDAAPYTVTSPKGNVYTVTEKGEIDYKEKSSGKDPSTLSDLEKYILGADGNGRNLIGEDGIIEPSDFSFIDDPLTTDVNEAETLGVEYLTLGTNKENTKLFLYAKYDNKAYRITCDDETYKSEELEVIYEPKGKEGQKTADEWTILYDNKSTVEAVSPTAMGELRLGYAEETTDSDKQLSQAIESYNSAITTINNYCKNLEGLPTNSGVRSVGASAETTTVYYSTDNLKKLNSAYDGVGLDGDTNFEQDLVRMAYWGVNSVGTDYWLASRVVEDLSYGVAFQLLYVSGGGNLVIEHLWSANFQGSANGDYHSHAVRPIITIENQ